MSDRHKEVIPAIRKVFPDAEYAYCQQHIGDNVQKEFGLAARRIYQAVAYAKTQAAYNEGIKTAYLHKGPLGDYLEKIPAKYYAVHALQRPRYGQYTSNMQESVNAWWDEARKLPAATMLLELWILLMMRIYQRREKAVLMQILTPLTQAYLTEERKSARKYKVDSSTNGKGRVTMANGAQHVVDLHASTCSCMAFQDQLIPCRHAIAICREHNEEPDNYINIIHTGLPLVIIATWRESVHLGYTVVIRSIYTLNSTQAYYLQGLLQSLLQGLIQGLPQDLPPDLQQGVEGKSPEGISVTKRPQFGVGHSSH